MRYVKQLLAFAVSFIKTAKTHGVAKAFVNVFKKKSCGASPGNGETLEQRKKNAEFTNTIYRLLAQPDCI